MAAKAYLVLTNVEPRVWRGAITNHRQTIGRGREAHVQLPTGFIHVSRRHAEVWAQAAKLWICDLHSTAGTSVNHVPLLPGRPFQLEIHDRICLGTAELDVKRSVALNRQSTSHSDEHPTTGLSKAHASLLAQPPQAFQQLTPAELEIVLHMSRGYRLDEIGGKLCRSRHTVRTHLQTIFRKLNIHARDELLASLRKRATEEESFALERRSDATSQ